MASIPDLVNLLCLDAHKSSSPFGGRHRTILISRDYSNTGDFAFNNLLQNFTRKEPQTPLLLITLSHDWTNYSAIAAKCGYNLRRSLNGGNIEVLNILEKYLDLIRENDFCDNNFNLCDFIFDYVEKFILNNSSDNNTTGDIINEGTRTIKPLVVMIDDLSLLLCLGCKANEIYRLFWLIDKSLRERSKEIQSNRLSYFIAQTMMTNINKSEQLSIQQKPLFDFDLNYLITNLENLCDLRIYLRPLDTGFSTRVDGTIKIIDYRLPATTEPIKQPIAGVATSSSTVNTLEEQLRSSSSLLFQPRENYGEIGTKKAFFFKLGDRRSRLTTNALIF